MILDNPGPQKPEREHIRQNRPSTKPRFYIPVTRTLPRKSRGVKMPDLAFRPLKAGDFFGP